MALRLTQHIRCGFMPVPVEALLPSVATPYVLETLGEVEVEQVIRKRGDEEAYERFKSGANQKPASASAC